MRIVVAAKGADTNGQRDVDVGSRLIRNSVSAAHQTKCRKIHWLLLGVEPGEQPLPQAVASDFRFVGNGHPVSAEPHAHAAQECGTMLIDPKVLLACPNDFHGPPGGLRQQHRFGRVLHARSAGRSPRPDTRCERRWLTGRCQARVPRGRRPGWETSWKATTPPASPATRAVHETGSMQACDRNGIENSASSTFAADFIAGGASPWLPIVGTPGCSSPRLSAASTVAEEASLFGWLA